MATSASRALVLAGYRRLLVASRQVFAGDAVALAASAQQLREEFRANKHVTDAAAIGACHIKSLHAVVSAGRVVWLSGLTLSVLACGAVSRRADGLVRGIKDAEDFLLHNVVQGKLNERGNYEVELSEEHGEGGSGDIVVEVAMQGDEHQDVPVLEGGCKSSEGSGSTTN